MIVLASQVSCAKSMFCIKPIRCLQYISCDSIGSSFKQPGMLSKSSTTLSQMPQPVKNLIQHYFLTSCTIPSQNETIPSPQNQVMGSNIVEP